MLKHAYLIIAHTQFDIVKQFIKLMDSEINDFYIHVDSKVGKFNQKEIINTAVKSHIYFINRMKVYWGDFSQIQCELLLLQAAVKEQYDYYHLCSGADFPIKSSEEISAFFEKNKGKEFLQFEQKTFDEKYLDRISKFHWFRKYQDSGFLFRYMEKISLRLQSTFKVNRLRGNQLTLQKGAQWFSITGNFAEYVLKQKKFIYQMFRHSSCADEMFLQTIFVNSPYAENLYEKKLWNHPRAIQRLIDWERGAPYVFCSEDWEELIHSEYLFARKFDTQVDSVIIRKLFNFLSGE